MPKQSVLEEDDEDIEERKSMSRMPKTNQVLAVLCSDIHLSDKAPIARSVEKDWMKVQASYLHQVDELCMKYQCPLIIAGDLFHKANVSAETVNLAMQCLPDKVYAIAGQHDLPLHNFEDIEKTSFWTLNLANKIYPLPHGQPIQIGDKLVVVGYPWQQELEWPTKLKKKKDKVYLAVAHAFVWNKKSEGFEGVSPAKHITKRRDSLEGNPDQFFDTLQFGDNHKGFWYMAEEHNEPWVINCGTLIRRKMDEMNYKPQVGLLGSRGEIYIHHLDTSADKFLEVDDALEAVEQLMEAGEFIKELRGIGSILINFKDAVMRFCERNGVEEEVVRFLKEVIDK